VGALATVTVCSLAEAEKIELPRGSWSRMLVTEERVDGNHASLGYSLFTKGTELQPVRHETEEVVYVVAGAGELRLEGEAIPFARGDALHIPAGVWHAVANTGDEDLLMVFGFPHPAYPPTERRG
jgi:quercetin dioxygenase-like cupin family protein